MADLARWTGQTAWTALGLTVVVLALTATVVVASSARTGTIHVSESGSYRLHLIPSLSGGSLASSCDTVPPSAGCSRKRHASPSSSLLLWEELAGGILVAAASVLVLWKVRRPQTPAATGPVLASLTQVRARRPPVNPREEVLATFADLEERLTSLGFTREQWEPPERYLGRAIPDFGHRGRAANTLARLYALARYSHHPIDSTAATQAIDASTELAALLGSGSAI